MAKKAKTTIIPTVLAFSRKIEVSDGIFQQCQWADKELLSPIQIREKRNRATKSNYGVADKEKAQPNISFGDTAALDHNKDTLKLTFTVKFLGDVLTPASCNNPEFTSLLASKQDEVSHGIYGGLAYRYAQNLACGRALWRNRLNADAVQVCITQLNNTEKGLVAGERWVIDAFDVDADNFTYHATPTQSIIGDISQIIKNALSSNTPALFRVETYALMGEGQQVFPSQQMRAKDSSTHKSKFLYSVKLDDKDTAGMHSEKIGNAIRTIDTWYEGKDDSLPIAIEPFGAKPTEGKAFRPNTNDFYTLLNQWLSDADVTKEEQQFIVANFIRGGVFGGE